MKKFKAASAAKRKIKEQFELEWEDEDTGETGEEVFTCYPGRAPGSTIFDIVTVGMGSVPMWDLFRTTMAEDFLRFKQFIEDEKHGVDQAAIREIVDWIIEYDTGTPTPPPPS